MLESISDHVSRLNDRHTRILTTDINDENCSSNEEHARVYDLLGSLRS